MACCRSLKRFISGILLVVCILTIGLGSHYVSNYHVTPNPLPEISAEDVKSISMTYNGEQVFSAEETAEFVQRYNAMKIDWLGGGKKLAQESGMEEFVHGLPSEVAWFFPGVTNGRMAGVVVGNPPVVTLQLKNGDTYRLSFYYHGGTTPDTYVEDLVISDETQIIGAYHCEGMESLEKYVSAVQEKLWQE